MTIRNKNMRKMLPIVIISILLGSMATAFAQPLLPMTVFGDVYVNDVLAGAGLNVYAKYGATVVAQTTTDAEGYYLLSIPEDSGVANGEPIDLWVETTNCETVTLEYQNMPLEQDLYVTSAASDTGTLTIETTPVTGEVFVAGVSWGTAPQSQVIEVGTYTVTFGAVSGYTTPASQEAVITLDSITLLTGTYVEITGDTGTLSITTTPVNGEVFVAGVSWGTAPQSQVIAVGTYTVTFGDVSGYTTPTSQEAVVTVDATIEVDGTYVVITDDPITPTDDFSIDYVSSDTADKGDVLTVIGSGVTAGTTVEVFWDYASGTYAHLLNTTDGDPDGTFECEITVPSDTVGDHYLWATDTSTGATVRYGPLTMVPKISLSPSSGLGGDEVTLKGYGFTAEANFTFTFGVDSLEVSPTDVESDEDGYVTCTFDVPEDAVYGTYAVTAEDFYGFADSANFILGASITLSVAEGPTGTVVEVEGRGWTEDATISFTLGGTAVLVVDEDVVTVDDEGLFSADIVIPDMASKDEYALEATETGGVKGPATEDFEVTGLPKITLSPGFGPPGAMVDIAGVNFTQIKDTVVTLDFGDDLLGIKTFKTDANGKFSGTFQAQAIAFSPPDHSVLATDEYGLSDDADFRLGMMVIIISPVSGPSGDFVYLTGTGFEPAGDWNATLGGELVAEGTATGEGTISAYFYAPTLDVGAHELVVLDVESEIELSTTFMITDTTRVTIDPADAPNDYNVTVEGYNFADKVGVLEFVLYNATEDWSLEIDVVTDPGAVAAVTDVDGNFTAYWIIPDEDTLSIGDYTINVTCGEDLFAQVSFSVAAELVDVQARKALFNRGDVLQFDVSNDFRYPDSYLKIWDPNDNLYWRTEVLDTWLKVSGLYTVPYYTQTSGGNPMLLAADAPLGTWTWTFYSSGTTNITDGTFDVGPSPASVLTGQIDELSDQITEITDRLGDVTDDLEDDIGDLAGDIADVVSEMETLRDDIVSDLAGDIAAATDAGNAAADAVEALEIALSDLEDSMGDIAVTSNSALDAAQLAADAAADAADAAQDAGDAADGLTGLVYGAIGASLIAALAAIVSLMQISKKIAG